MSAPVSRDLFGFSRGVAASFPSVPPLKENPSQSWKEVGMVAFRAPDAAGIGGALKSTFDDWHVREVRPLAFLPLIFFSSFPAKKEKAPLSDFQF